MLMDAEATNKTIVEKIPKAGGRSIAYIGMVTTNRPVDCVKIYSN